MGYEIVYTALVGGIFSLFGIYLMYNLSSRKMKMEQEYNIKRFKLGKRYKIKELELPAKTSKPSDKMIDQLIQKYAPRLLGGEEEEEEDNIENLIGSFVTSDAGKEIIANIMGKNKQEQENTYTGIR